MNRSDSVGDEGELFRRLMMGEALTSTQIAAIRAENDKGVIFIDGEAVEVEFWIGDAFKAAGSFVSDVTRPVRDVARSVGSAVQSGVDTAAGVVRGSAEGASDGLGAMFGAPGTAAGDVIRGAAGGLTQLGKGVVDLTVWPVINTFEGRLADAIEAPVHGLSRILLQGPERVLNGFLDAAETLSGAVPIPIVADVLTRGVDTVRTLTSTAVGLADDAFRFVAGTPVDMFRHLETGVKRLFQGNFVGFGLSLFWGAMTPVTNGLGLSMDGLFRVASAVGAVAGNAGLSPPSRGLSAEEKADLRVVFGDSVDLDQIRVRRNDPSNQLGMSPHTVGNTIYMPETMRDARGNPIPMFNPDGTLTTEGKIVLAHEVGHVWQNQNGGGDYMHTAICAQCTALASTTASGGPTSVEPAYDWRAQAAAGVPFDELTPEQQASLVEDAAAAQLLGDGDGVLETSDFRHGSYRDDPMTAAELAYMREALVLVRRGDSASIHGGLG